MSETASTTSAQPRWRSASMSGRTTHTVWMWFTADCSAVGLLGLLRERSLCTEHVRVYGFGVVRFRVEVLGLLRRHSLCKEHVGVYGFGVVRFGEGTRPKPSSLLFRALSLPAPH